MFGWRPPKPSPPPREEIYSVRWKVLWESIELSATYQTFAVSEEAAHGKAKHYLKTMFASGVEIQMEVQQPTKWIKI